MRTWGRIYDNVGNYTWQKITTDSNGNNDAVYVTTLIQNLKLNLGESPFYAQNGIPAQKSVISQIFPDFYVQRVQQQFSKYFASLLIAKPPTSRFNPYPLYAINVLTNQGTRISTEVPV
jgi:hypothetical protein